MTGSDFRGIPTDAVEFYRELRADNTKVWWTANKQRYDGHVREPLTHLVDLLADEFGEASLFRPYRDVRFSPDKTPYKDHQGALAMTDRGVGYYVQLSADGLMTGGGFNAAGPDQTQRMRAAIDDDLVGGQLQRICDALVEAGFVIDGEQLKTKPRGVSDDHPRLALMRHKSMIVLRRYGIPSWLDTPAVVDHVRQDWRTIRPLVEWLSTHVGPTTVDRGPRPGRG